MALFFQRASNGAPAVHALIVGVSDYRNLPEPGTVGTNPERTLGLSRLKSPALSAYRIAKWLADNADALTLPLATVRLLVSPSPREIAAEPALAGFGDADRPTFARVQAEAHDWRTDADAHPDGATIFYFCGHGIAFGKDNDAMLLDDFGGAVGSFLQNSVSIRNVAAGMAASGQAPNIAQTQYYFTDACRVPHEQLVGLGDEGPSSMWSSRSEKDDRHWPIFYSTVSGSEAHGVPGDSSVFARGLLDALENGSDGAEMIDGDLKWPVTSDSLKHALTEYFKGLNLKQVPGLGGFSKDDVPIRILPAPPKYKVAIRIDPEALKGTGSIVIEADHQKFAQYSPPPVVFPYEVTLPGGLYLVTAKKDKAGPPLVLPLQVDRRRRSSMVRFAS